VPTATPTPTATPSPTATPVPTPTPTPIPPGTFVGGPITFNDSGAATPYPSTILVSGIGNSTTSVTLTLNNFQRSARPDDVDMLLVSPTGATFIVFSDVGGNGGATGTLTITLSDAAVAFLPDNGPLISRTFKPTNESNNETGP